MLDFLKNKLTSKKIGYWLTCGAALIAFVAMIIFAVYRGKNGLGMDGIYAFIILGVALQIGLFFYEGKFGSLLALVAIVFYALAAGYSIEGGVGNITDYFSGIVCFGVPELAPMNFAIAALLLVSIVLSIVGCFLGREKVSE